METFLQPVTHNRTWRQRLGHVAMNFLVLGLMVIAVLVIISVRSPGGTRLLDVRTGSMQPTLPIGTLIVVRPASTYHANDIVTFRPAGKRTLVTHRIVGISQIGTGTMYTTQGDANAAPDSQPVPAKAIFGRVWFHIPFFGYVFRFLETPLGVIGLIVVPAMLILQSEARKLRVAWREMHRPRYV